MAYVRFLVEYGIYHVYNRGHNKMAIFNRWKDKDIFLRQIRRSQVINGFQIYAYSIMNNHYHLLYKDVDKNISSIIGTIQENYAKYYTKKYNHVGAVFINPFKSTYILDRNHFYNSLSYILNNPVKANITASHLSYRWNSPLDGSDQYNIVDYLYPLHMFQNTLLTLDEFIVKRLKDKRVFADELTRMKDNEARVIWEDICLFYTGTREFQEGNFTLIQKMEIIKEARYLKLSIRQIAKFSGLSHRFIENNKSELDYI